MFTGDLPRAVLKLHFRLTPFSVHNSYNITLLCTVYIFTLITGHWDTFYIFYSCRTHSFLPFYIHWFYLILSALQCFLYKRWIAPKVAEFMRWNNKKTIGLKCLSVIICSFGIVIWEILTQQKPYAGKIFHVKYRCHFSNKSCSTHLNSRRLKAFSSQCVFDKMIHSATNPLLTGQSNSLML